MARIIISGDGGRMTHSERVIPSDLDSPHPRRCLIERVQLTISDAHPQAGGAITTARSRPSERYPRTVSVAAVRDATRKRTTAGESRRLAPAS